MNLSMRVIRGSESEKAQEIAQKFESQGYSVFTDPAPENIPFDLEGYTPDLIAMKDSGGIIVEIKASLKRLPTQKFHEISKLVSSHQGWRFALVTLDDPVSKAMSVAETDLPDKQALKGRLKDIDALIKMNMLSSALMSLCIQIESWLRIKARMADLPFDFLQPQRLMNHLYSDGEISIDQLDQLQDLMQLRNKVVHGFDVDVTMEQVDEATTLLHEIINNTES